VRSVSEAKLRRVCVAAALGFVLSAAVGAASQGERPSSAQISAAVAQLENDPNIAGAHKMRVLRWAGKRQTHKPSDLPDWIEQISRFFAWLAEAGRYAVWADCTLVVAVLAIYLLRTLPKRWRNAVTPAIAPPTHVQDLDIRPGSLPEDIGTAALELWDRGEHRAALALLYRGCLSRLVHAHNVPVRDSTTEGECVALAARHLSSTGSAYVSRLVHVWQHAVYRGEQAPRGVVLALCESFGAALDPPPAPDPERVAA
jgi:hypothetical protein